MTLTGDVAELTMLNVPDDGSAEISISYVYKFERRSHLN